MYDSLHHDFGLFYEIVLRHGAFFNHLNGHVMLTLPLPVLHHPKLPIAQLLDEGEVSGFDLPHAWRKEKEAEVTRRVCIQYIRGMRESSHLAETVSM